MSKISSMQRVETFKEWLLWFNKHRPKPKVKVENHNNNFKSNKHG